MERNKNTWGCFQTNRRRLYFKSMAIESRRLKSIGRCFEGNACKLIHLSFLERYSLEFECSTSSNITDVSDVFVGQASNQSLLVKNNLLGNVRMTFVCCDESS